MSFAAFNVKTGQYWTNLTDRMTDPDAVIKEVPDGVASWRLSIDLETHEVVVKYAGSNNSDAEISLAADRVLEAEANAIRDAAKRAEREAALAAQAEQAEGGEDVPA